MPHAVHDKAVKPAQHDPQLFVPMVSRAAPLRVRLELNEIEHRPAADQGASFDAFGENELRMSSPPTTAGPAPETSRERTS